VKRRTRRRVRTGVAGQSELQWASVDQDLEYQILENLEDATESVGSGNLQLILRERDISVSPATVGRILRLLDHERLTVKVSNRGRVLTPTGRQYLEELRRRETRKRRASAFLREVEPAKRDEFRSVLDALRIIESQMTALTAERATAAEIQAMRDALERQRGSLEAPGQGASQGADFHQLVLESCRNRFLLAAANVLWSSNEQLRELWYQANDLTGVSSYAEHVRILRAIEARQPVRAQQAMDAHFVVFIDALTAHLSSPALLTVADTPAPHHLSQSSPG